MKTLLHSIFLAAVCSLAFSMNVSAGEASCRRFIAHRGVNLHSTIAGENSLEAIKLAARGGFYAVETDVRLTSDDSLMVMHDPTLNRTCLDRDSKPLNDPIEISSLTYRDLRDKYILKADSPKLRSKIPTLHEYLLACRDNGIYCFIEPKLVDTTGVYYRRIIDMANAVFGKGKWTFTSNNRANNIVRRSMGIADVRMMGILYQTTFDSINSLGNIVMAISTSRFDEAAYNKNVALAKSVGLETESHADKFARFNFINNNPIDYVSTDVLAADPCASAKTVADIKISTPKTLKIGEKYSPEIKTGKIAYGGAYLTLNVTGKVKVKLDKQNFTVSSDKPISHQVIVYDEVPVVTIEALSDDVVINDLSLLVLKY